MDIDQQIKTVYLVVLLFLMFPHYGLSAIDLSSGYWETSYNCDMDGNATNGDTEWLEYSDPLECDGLSKAGAWRTSDGHYEQIIKDANYSGGIGGKGQRHWIGDGTNNNSGGVDITFSSPQTNFWMRWYVRWEEGFSSNWHTFKMLYLWSQNVSGIVFHAGYPVVSGINLYSSRDHYNCSHCGYGYGFYSTGISDGSWQLLEIHINIPEHIFQSWLNEELIVDRNDVDFGSVDDVKYITIGSNCKDVNNGMSMYVDYDDVAVSTLGYIGPVVLVDINSDGDVNTQDIQACVNHILGNQDWGDRADINNDETVNAQDLQAIVNEILQ